MMLLWTCNDTQWTYLEIAQDWQSEQMSDVEKQSCGVIIKTDQSANSQRYLPVFPELLDHHHSLTS